MRIWLFVCAGLLFLGVADLPYGSYTLLRIAVSIGSIAIIIGDSERVSSTWRIIFAIILILFNPIIPVYLKDKSLWIPIDLICGALFLAKASFNSETK